MRVFKYIGFNKFAAKENITDDDLFEIVDRLEKRQASVNLGGQVYKVRVARIGEGKSGGNRVIVYFKNKFRTFFVYGFSKNDRDNINGKELRVFKKDAKDQFMLTDDQIITRLRNETLIEIIKE